MRFSWRKRFNIIKNLFLEGCNRLKSLLYLYIFLPAYQYMYLLCICWSGPDEVHQPWSEEAAQKNLLSFEYADWLKMH